MADRGYILLFSHMRSQSTLLAHILGSHPEIDGYTELHQHYESPIDLRNMTRRIEEHTGERRRGRYAFDKLLHNMAIVDRAILLRDDVKVVFLLRNARDTIPSIVRAGRYDDTVLKIADPAVATNYYVTRLERIDQYSEWVGGRAALVEAEKLVADTGAVLAGLTRFLELETPLTPTYAKFKHTGERGLGDMGPNILAGRVLRDEERDRSGEPVVIPDELMAQAIAAHARVMQRLRARHPPR